MAASSFARAILAALAVSTSTLAMAQDAPPPADERVASDGDIVVTAQRRAQSLLDVPLTRSPRSAATPWPIAASPIRRSSATRSRTSRSTAPMAIRSQTSRCAASGSRRTNITATKPRPSASISMTSISRRAPAAAWASSTSTASRCCAGRRVHCSAATPTAARSTSSPRKPGLSGTNGYLQVSYANFDTFTAQGAAEAALAEDVAGLRLAVNYAKGDGQIKNIFPGRRDAASVDTLQGRASLRVKPAETLDIVLRAYAGRDRGTQAAVHGFAPARDGLGFSRRTRTTSARIAPTHGAFRRTSRSN